MNPTFRDQTDVFASARRKRQSRFHAKDEVIIPLLESVPVPHPKTFRAVLMPCLYGPELTILERQGVLREHLFSVERDPQVHAIQRDPKLPAHQHLHGIRTTPRPMGATEAIDHVHMMLGQVDLAYLDFFGQPALTHWTLLFKIFRLRLLAPRAVLILTFGGSRGEPFACQVNNRLKGSVTQAYVDSALLRAHHPTYQSCAEHPYVSANLPYMTTEFRF